MNGQISINPERRRDGVLRQAAEVILHEMVWTLVENSLNFDRSFKAALMADPHLKVTHDEIERVMTAVFGDEDWAEDYPFEIDVTVDL